MAAPRKKQLPRRRVIVIGSLNLDHFARVEVLPRPGDTVSATRLTRFYGGKGANQAIAAARQGSAVVLLGAVGSDEAGEAYLRFLEEEGVSTRNIRIVDCPTGTAFITVDQSGENMIVVAAGANAELRRTDIIREAPRIKESDILVGQFEVPFSALLESICIANQSKVPVLINPSPFRPGFLWEEVRTDYLVVNENEAVALLGIAPVPSAAREVRDQLHALRIRHLIVTRGGEETLHFTQEGEVFAIPVLPVLPVDTVGAGDAFAGCLAARLSQGEPIASALRAANCAGALTTLGSGAQGPMPDRDQVERHLRFLDL